MTLFGAAFKAAGWGTASAPSTLVPRDDIVTSDRVIGDTMALIALDTDYSATYEEIATRQLWVRIAVNKLAYSIGRLPLKTYRRGAGSARERASDSPLAELLARPNDSKETGNPAGFRARVAYDLFVYGNALIVTDRRAPDALPTQLWPAPVRGWRVANDGDYVYRDPVGRETRLPAWRVIHICEPGPLVGGFGTSRLEAARLTLAIEHAAQRLGVATFQNGARPGGLITIKGGLGTGSDRAEAVERFKTEIVRRFGGVSKSGLPAVLEGDVTWEPMSHNLSESAVVDHRQLTREEVAALYDIPQPAMGILDEANFASVSLLHVMFYQDTLGWPVALIENALNQQLVDGVAGVDDQFVEFDLNAVMRGDIESRYRAYATAITTGFKTPDEVRALENDPPMVDVQPDAGRLLFPLNLAGAVGAQLAADTEV